MMDLDTIEKEMWVLYALTLPQSINYCNWCYNITDNTCECAERRFYNRLTEGQITSYMETKKEKELELINEQINELILLKKLYE
jgi:hypothetical protein